MRIEQKVVIVADASQGIGAGLVRAHRDGNDRMIGNSRSVKASADADILAVPGGHQQARDRQAHCPRRAREMVALVDITHWPELFARRPDYHSAYDSAAAWASRLHMLDRVATDRTMVRGYHFAFPTVGRIARNRKGFELALAHTGRERRCGEPASRSAGLARSEHLRAMTRGGRKS